MFRVIKRNVVGTLKPAVELQKRAITREKVEIKGCAIEYGDQPFLDTL
jgi:hypothetical protein